MGLPAVIEAGRLNKRIELQRATSTRDVTGEPLETWATYTTVWGRVISGAGAERIVGQEVTGRGGLVLQIRYRTPQPTLTERAKLGTRIFDINDVSNVEERNAELLLTCTEVTG